VPNKYNLPAFGRRLAFVIGWLIIFSGVMGQQQWPWLCRLFKCPLRSSEYHPLDHGGHLSGIIFAGINSLHGSIIFTLIEALGLIIIIIPGDSIFGQRRLPVPFGMRGIFQASA
jgi:APA family basic amino acid/polyamine antiporter